MTTARNFKWMFSILALTGACAQAAPVFEQVSTAVSTSWTSQLGVGQGAYQTFDDFKLGHDAAINKVTWQGTYFSADAGGLHGAAPNTTSWTVEFWSGDASGPLAQQFSRDYAVSDARSTRTKAVQIGNLSFDLYDFEIDSAPSSTPTPASSTGSRCGRTARTASRPSSRGPMRTSPATACRSCSMARATWSAPPRGAATGPSPCTPCPSRPRWRW